MADKLRVKIDGAPTAASLLQAPGPTRGACREGETPLVLSRSEYGYLLRRWRAQGTGRERQVPDKLFGYRYAVDEKFQEVKEPKC